MINYITENSPKYLDDTSEVSEKEKEENSEFVEELAKIANNMLIEMDIPPSFMKFEAR